VNPVQLLQAESSPGIFCALDRRLGPSVRVAQSQVARRSSRMCGPCWLVPKPGRRGLLRLHGRLLPSRLCQTPKSPKSRILVLSRFGASRWRCLIWSSGTGHLHATRWQMLRIQATVAFDPSLASEQTFDKNGKRPHRRIGIVQANSVRKACVRCTALLVCACGRACLCLGACKKATCVRPCVRARVSAHVRPCVHVRMLRVWTGGATVRAQRKPR
jgi:hypothetical protein